MIPANNNLPGWDDFCKLAGADKPKNLMVRLFGITKSKIGDVTRLNARFRLAKEIKTIEYETYELRTAEGYTALFKAFLACNVLELYSKLIGLKNMLEVSNTLYSEKEISNLIKEIAILDKKKLFFSFIEERTDGKMLKPILDDYLAGNTYNPISLLVGIRHIFAHGILTPNANKDSISAVKAIASLLASNVLDKIATDFAHRVSQDKANG